MQRVFLVSHVRDAGGEDVLGVAATVEAGRKLGESRVCQAFVGAWEHDEEGDVCRPTSVGWLWVTGYDLLGS